MRKFFLFLVIVGFVSLTTTSKAQLIDEQNVTVTMELQPILQLNMTTPDHIEFIFDDIREYYSGIIKYGATVLKVSSSVNWDLYAVGTSTGGVNWDQQISYSSVANVNSVSALPFSALELHQTAANAYVDAVPAVAPWTDYSNKFVAAQSVAAANIGMNSIYGTTALLGAYTPPLTTEKYIQGTAGLRTVLLPTLGALSGSYLTAQAVLPAFTSFYYVIDYRILPGLPAVFPAAGTNAAVSEALNTVNTGAYAEPGVYTMNVKYVLLEDQ